MKRWVVGFLFNEGKVALVLKTHPEWQAGKLNGVGGNIDEGETPLQAMQREFLEEAGADVKSWREFAIINVEVGTVRFFAAQGDYKIVSKTEEEVDWYPTDDVKNLPIVPNLEWLIPMALEAGVKYASIDTHDPSATNPNGV